MLLICWLLFRELDVPDDPSFEAAKLQFDFKIFKFGAKEEELRPPRFVLYYY